MGKSIIQSVIINKNLYSRPVAKRWIKKHNFKDYKVDETPNYYRFRQTDPKQFKKKGMQFRMKEVAPGVHFVLAI